MRLVTSDGLPGVTQDRSLHHNKPAMNLWMLTQESNHGLRPENHSGGQMGSRAEAGKWS